MARFEFTVVRRETSVLKYIIEAPDMLRAEAAYRAADDPMPESEDYLSSNEDIAEIKLIEENK